jgi:ribosomal protein L28
MRKGPFVLAGALALLLMYFAAVPWLHYIRKSRRTHSPECLAALHDAAKRKADHELTNQKIKADMETRRLQLENLHTEDRIAELEGRPIKNRMKEALIESSISGLKNDVDTSFIDQYLIDAACK